MSLTRAGLAAAAVLFLARAAGPQGTLQVDHTPPSCFLAGRAPLVIACLTPRSARADVRVLFRADDGPWYATALRSEMPCYRGALPRPSEGTPAVSYVIEAQAQGMTARSAEQRVPVAETCAGAAPVAPQRGAWESPPGAPRTPPGFEGSRVRDVEAPRVEQPRVAEPRVAEKKAATPRPEAVPRRPDAVPTRRPVAPVEPAAPSTGAATKGGHGLRNAAIVLGGAAAAGGAAEALRSEESGPPPTTAGTGLPAGGVPGVYVGVETVVYSGSCTGTDDVVLNLQQSGTALSGVLTFTVRSCPCCSAGRGATPISGFVSDLRVEFSTPTGFGYSGSFAGNRLSGGLSGPGGISGTWTVEKR